MSGAMRKRQRVRDQRTIPVQHDTQQGPRSVQTGQSGLPPVIDVDKFVEARNFEIGAMVKAMRASKEALTQRAFQSLPRHLRRRAASHNVRRLPTSLRKRAVQEVPQDSAKPKHKTRKLLGRKRRFKFVTRGDHLKRRQRFKLWLETHMWHAKRMHMVNIWGHRLATRPTAKAFRSSYRASKHGAIVHDASYYQYLTLTGTKRAIENVLDQVCDKMGPKPGSLRYSQGQRECLTTLYESSNQFPRGQIGPISLIWDTPPLPFNSVNSFETLSNGQDQIQRKVLIRVHPAMAVQALQAIKNIDSVKSKFETSFMNYKQSRKLDKITQENKTNKVELTVHEKEFLTFEILGSRSTQVVKGILKLSFKNNEETKQLWNSLDVEIGPKSVPQGMIVGLQVYDPRLSFPPKLDKTHSTGQFVTPSSEIARIESFWSRSTRTKLRKPTFKKHELDERRSKNLIPGTRLTALAQDDRIPVLLIQRSLSSSTSSSTSSVQDDVHALFGWTLIVPSGWGSAFWSSLVFTNTRVGGIEQIQQQDFESSRLNFPNDFIGSKLIWKQFELNQTIELKEFWKRRLKSNRINFKKNQIEKPWEINLIELRDLMLKRFELILDDQVQVESSRKKDDEHDSPVSHYTIEYMMEMKSKFKQSMKAREPFTISNLVVNQLIEIVNTRNGQSSTLSKQSTTSSTGVVDFAQQLFKAYKSLEFNDSSSTKEESLIYSINLLKDAFVHVQINPIGRGKLENFGLIYWLDQLKFNQVVEKLNLNKGRGGSGQHFENNDELELCQAPSPQDVCGRITTGGFSLSRGRGFGIGIVPLIVFIKLYDTNLIQNKNDQGLVLVRNLTGQVFRAAKISLV
ncbi:Ribonucleases P/MRP protein subunit pop1 [Microbotryomycetes sp. JL221]|nr:Ribonucleases P/MRP protein subunit pop1 [Microbotryomycetes sp. JL221]